MSRKPYHHEDLKRELIEKGIELVNSDGQKSFSLRKVAAACGVSHAAPYSHFANKDELLEAMQSHITDEFSRVLEHSIAQSSRAPDILSSLGKAYVEFFLASPHYFSFLYTQSNLLIDLSPSADSTTNYRPFEIYKELAIALMEKSGYPKERQQDALIALWSFIHGIASLATMRNVCYDEDWEQKITDLMSVFNCSFIAGKEEEGSRC